LPVHVPIFRYLISPSVFTVAVFTQLEVGTQRPFQDIEEEEEE